MSDSERNERGAPKSAANESKAVEQITSAFWQEVPEEDDPFTAALCRCAGYDVYGDVLARAGLVDFLFLLLRGQAPTAAQSHMLEILGVALANPGPRNESVHAAMAGAAGGSSLAACLMAALAAGSGSYGGTRELHEAMLIWECCGEDIALWRSELSAYKAGNAPRRRGHWPEQEHPPGFDPYGASCATPVRQVLDALVPCGGNGSLKWLRSNRERLEEAAAMPLSMCGVAAAALHTLAFDVQAGEALYLLLRLPGAAAHALEQHRRGAKDFPFHREGIHLTNDPGSAHSADNS